MCLKQRRLTSRLVGLGLRASLVMIRQAKAETTRLELLQGGATR
jgi:hypothetical protein